MTQTADILLRLTRWSLVRETASGPVTVLREIDLTLERGEWIGVLGSNGSGKTSLLRFLAGEESPLAGRTAMVFQDPDEGFVGGSVAEELALGRPELSGPEGEVRLQKILVDYHLERFTKLDPRLLSAGQKQRLAVAVALAAGPSLLLCDEPTSLQDRESAGWLLNHLRRWWTGTDRTVLFATQRLEEAELCDRLLFLQDGRLVAQGPPRDLLTRLDIRELLGETRRQKSAPMPYRHVGRDPDTEASSPEPTKPVAAWRGVACSHPSTGFAFRDVDLIIRPGQRLGITGPNGCGKSTLLAIAAGVKPPDAGTCFLQEHRLYQRGKPDLDHGAALLAPQFPEYLFTRARVQQEIELDPALARYGVTALLEAVGLPTEVATRNPHDLSSGQKRRLALGLVIFSDRPLLLLDEPTAGLDHPGRRRIRELLDAVSARAAVVVASHDPGFLADCGCEIFEMSRDGLRPLSAQATA